MADRLEFFNPIDPFGLADWEVQSGPNPSVEKQRASALGQNGDEIAFAQYGEKESGTCEYIAKSATGNLSVPNVGMTMDGYHIDSVQVSYSQTEWPKLSISWHKHNDGNVDSGCREYAPSVTFPARAIGVPSSLGSAFSITPGTSVGMRSVQYQLQCNHVEEMNGDGGNLAGDNYDGSETLTVEFTGNVSQGAWTLGSDWTDDTFAKSMGNTSATTSTLTATHHLEHTGGTAAGE